jgi:hypothetical protein
MNNILREIKISLIIGSIFIIFMLLISLLGYTVVPVDQFYKRGHLPWANISPEIGTSNNWNYGDYRNGDALFETSYYIIETLKQKSSSDFLEKPSYSLETALGYPLGPSYSYNSGITLPIAELLLIMNPGQYEKATYSAMNLSAGFWGFLAFVILWLMSYLIIGKSIYNFIVAIAANPMIFLCITEPWLMSIVGCLIIALSLVILIKNKDRKGYCYASFFIAFIGSVIIYKSNIFQIFVYVPLFYILSSFYLIKVTSLKKYIYLGLSIVFGILLNIEKLYWSFDFLQQSNKAISGYAPSILNRGYAALPIQSMIELPLLDYIQKTLPAIQKIFSDQLAQYISFLIPKTYLLFGLPIFLLGLIGLLKIKNNHLKIILFLVILYWIGPFQYVLSVTIGGPFKTETSIRIVYFVYILFVFLAAFSLKNNLFVDYKNMLIFLSLLCSICLITQIFAISYFGSPLINERFLIWTSGIIQLVTIFFFICFLKYKGNKNKIILILLIVFMLLIPVSNGFFYRGNQSLVPEPIEIGIPQNKILKNSFNGNQNVGALIVNAKDGTTGSFHPNFWNINSERVTNIHAYKNPFLKEYSQLFWYQYSSNDKINYGDNRSSEEEFSKVIRNNWLSAIPISNGSFSKETERFFDLTGVNLIATKQNVHIQNPEWNIVGNYEGVKIWHRFRNFEPIRGICKYNIIYENNSDITTLKKLLSDESMNIENEALLTNEIEVNECMASPKVRDVKIGKNGIILIDVEGGGGLIVTNYVFNNGFQALDTLTNQKIQIIKVNHAFIGLKLPKELKLYKIKMFYEKPKLFRSGFSINIY